MPHCVLFCLRQMEHGVFESDCFKWIGWSLMSINNQLLSPPLSLQELVKKTLAQIHTQGSIDTFVNRRL